MSSKKDLVQTYMEGFRRSDHTLILSCLTDDIVWVLPGYTTLTGKEAFDREIENDSFEGSPSLTVDRLVEEDDIVVAVGGGQAAKKGGGVLRFVFCDVFTFTAGKISRLESYLVNLS